MLRRYRKIEVDSRFSAAEDRGHYSICGYCVALQTSFISFISPSISFYLLLSPKQAELAKVELTNFSLWYSLLRLTEVLQDEAYLFSGVAVLVDVPMVASQFLHQFWTAFDVLAQVLHSGFDVLPDFGGFNTFMDKTNLNP